MQFPDMSHPVVQNFSYILLLSFIPIILVSLTSFTRYVIVLSLMRTALGLQQTPPNIVIIALAFFMSLFSMSPLLVEIQTGPYENFQTGKYDYNTFISESYASVKSFIVSKTDYSDYEFVASLGSNPLFAKQNLDDDVEFIVLAPAFMLTELKAAFQFAFVIFIPFVLIDLVVASILMALGMIMLPPVSISLPVKLLVFILVDGWTLLIGGLVSSF
ncbi:EscR/YscR/HrcR family type III secretion system export apparatus protein [Motilimonas cestriensis]|uniref:EscR/YscR/HrcR family type III secretion system export apparatus protein n=1 Tax=Motilimonas cestriensis TaxID=2742685 RepID=A0ABS8WFQ1_9GAMM|nr:flagellar type III secretion system pore protein FliP [Motilimonas cestriensis]MCE2597128.1 EscR/YscR/HrcR family type III secretion system export apparatus protein [Motilimonas cestriensis]